MISAVADQGTAWLRWSIELAGSGDDLLIERRQDGEAFEVREHAKADASGLVSYRDYEVEPGHVYRYRLGYPTTGGYRYTDEAVVAIPGLSGLSARATPNPWQGTMRIDLTLPAAGTATIEIIDPAGRLWAQRRVSDPKIGTHSVTLDTPSAMPAGIYFLRVRQDRATRSVRICRLK